MGSGGIRSVSPGLTLQLWGGNFYMCVGTCLKTHLQGPYGTCKGSCCASVLRGIEIVTPREA